MEKKLKFIRCDLLRSWSLLIAAYTVSSQRKIFAEEHKLCADRSLQPLIIALRQTTKPVCVSTAEQLEKKTDLGNWYSLHLRSAKLSSPDALLLSNTIRKIHEQNNLRLNSFSVSYNPDIQKDGAQALLSSLPHDVGEIGMVGCQLKDDVGELLIHFMDRSSNLKMICVEGNLFTSPMRNKIAAMARELNGCVTIV
jgi:hypothetical protein